MAIAEELVCCSVDFYQEGTQFSIIMPYGIKNTLWEKLGFFKSLGIKEHLPIRLTLINVDCACKLDRVHYESRGQFESSAPTLKVFCRV